MRAPHRIQSFLLLSLPLLAAACAATPAPEMLDSAEAIFALPAQQVRDAVVEVLTEDGYDVEVTQAQSADLARGSRREIDSPWDWLLRTRFGVGRSQAEARITELDGSSTKLTVLVQHQAKAAIWGTWTGSQPPVPQSAGNYVRMVKNYLKVL